MRTDENTVGQASSLEYRNSIFELYAVTDDNVSVNVYALRQNAFAANLCPGSDLSFIPHPRTVAKRRVRRDFRGLVDTGRHTRTITVEPDYNFAGAP
jgi:hypothetical protein